MKLFLTLFTVFLFVASPVSSGSQDTYVYICMGKTAYSYHRNSNCSGLNRCKAEIRKVSTDYARSIGRKPCGICYK